MHFMGVKIVGAGKFYLITKRCLSACSDKCEAVARPLRTALMSLTEPSLTVGLLPEGMSESLDVVATAIKLSAIQSGPRQLSRVNYS